MARATRDSRRARRALDSARIIDEVVNNQLVLISRLPEDGRRRAADFLAELVMLAQSYRHYAFGWITRKELQRRGLETMRRLSVLRGQRASSAQFTERD